MLKVTIFSVAVLVLTCHAQPPPPPPPPDFAETFVAQYEIFREKQENYKSGNGAWVRSTGVGHFLDTLILTYTTHYVRREHIRFFDKHVEYTINFDDDNKVTNCTSRLIPEGLTPPTAWGWLEGSQYHPYTPPNGNETYSSWIAHNRLGSSQVVVRPEQPDKPYLLIETHHSGDIEKWEFIMFEAVVPPESIYEVPEECSNKYPKG